MRSRRRSSIPPARMNTKLPLVLLGATLAVSLFASFSGFRSTSRTTAPDQTWGLGTGAGGKPVDSIPKPKFKPFAIEVNAVDAGIGRNAIRGEFITVIRHAGRGRGSAARRHAGNRERDDRHRDLQGAARASWLRQWRLGTADMARARAERVLMLGTARHKLSGPGRAHQTYACAHHRRRKARRRRTMDLRPGHRLRGGPRGRLHARRYEHDREPAPDGGRVARRRRREAAGTRTIGQPESRAGSAEKLLERFVGAVDR